GVNIPSNTQRSVFIYEVASATILRSRTVNNVSSVLAVSPDGQRFMAGLNLFDINTLEILAQQNLANAPYPIPPNTNFTTQTNHPGGRGFRAQALVSVFRFCRYALSKPAGSPEYCPAHADGSRESAYQHGIADAGKSRRQNGNNGRQRDNLRNLRIRFSDY